MCDTIKVVKVVKPFFWMLFQVAS
jgi:hypothetical protein